METYEPQTLSLFEDESQFYQQAYPANRHLWPGSEKAKRMIVGSGRQLSTLLDASSPLGAFSKILLASSAWTNSEEYCYVWTRLDTRFALSAFQLTQLEPSTGDNESLLWPTAHTNCATGAGTQGRDGGLNLQTAAKLWPTPTDKGNHNKAGLTEKSGNGLATAAKLYPTPIAKDAEQGSGKGHHLNPKADKKAGTRLYEAAKLWPTPRKEGYDAQGNGHGDLVYELKNRLLPTPISRDFKSGSQATQQERGRTAGPGLPEVFQGSLNPRFVEELMGFEVGHTDLKHWETLSVRNRHIHSSRQSTKSKRKTASDDHHRDQGALHD